MDSDTPNFQNNGRFEIKQYQKDDKPSKWHNFVIKFQEFIKTDKGKKTLIISGIILIVIIILAITIYNRYIKSDSSKSANPLSSIFTGKDKDQDKTQTEASKLDNIQYTLDVANRHPLAVMIENHPDARPQSGMDKASLVYEAIAEGGITRFMAVYGPNAPEKIGPTRSARTYYLDWALEYDAFYAHVGGNIDALDLIPQIGIKDLDQFRYGTEAYWREAQVGKATEHTMYADANKLYTIAQNNKWDMKAKFDSLIFKDDLAKDQRPASQSITINFSSDSYLVKWEYDPQTNSYKRYMAGAAHKDAVSNEQLSAKNIVVQEVERQAVVTRINENGWKMTTTGSGKGKLYMDGKEIELTWKKKDREDRTRFYDSFDKEVEFNSGTTWYEIVPPGTPVTVK